MGSAETKPPLIHDMSAELTINVKILPAEGEKLSLKLTLPPKWTEKPSAKLKPFFAKQFAARRPDAPALEAEDYELVDKATGRELPPTVVVFRRR